MISVPEIPYKISPSEEALACLRRMTKIFLDLKEINQRNANIVDDLRKLRLGLNKLTSRKTVESSDLAPDPSSGIDSVGVICQGFRGPSNHQWDQTMLRNFKLQMQSQAVHVSDLSILTKPTSRKTVASSDLDPDPSSGLDYGGVIDQGLRGPSNHQRYQTMLRNFKLQMQPQAVPVSDFYILTNPTSRKIVASSDLSPDTSAGLNSGGVISQGFHGSFLLNSSCRYFEKVDIGQKMSSQIWIRMAGYRNYITYAGQKLNNKLRMAGYRKYISYRYIFISSFVSLTKYAGQNLKILVWLRMAGEFISTSLYVYYFSSELWLRMAGYQNYFC